MSVEVVLGLPYLSAGPLTETARKLQAPVLLSANAFSVWRDDGPMPEKWIDPCADNRARRDRTWIGWNLRQLKNAKGLASIDLDSAGYVAQAVWGGYPWTPESYIFDLCAKYPFRRFSSLDLCVEPEVARDRDTVRERISKTVALNAKCRMLARDAGIADRLMHVIQGATAEDYLRCFDAMSGMIGDHAVIGVGSMCRRKAQGEDGIIAIVDRLDRALPAGVKLHLFGLKSDGAEAVAMLDSRVASIDSQAYGVRARHLAQEKRATDPGFSKSNAFVAGVMASWWQGQVARMDRGKLAVLQAGLPLPSAPETRPATVFDAMLVRARALYNQLIEEQQLDADQIIPDSWLIATVVDWYDELPSGVHPSDPFHGLHQLPDCFRENEPYVDPDLLHPSIRPMPYDRLAA